MKWNSTYIRENGLLELYLLDELNEAERHAVEDAIGLDPELRKEMTALEIQFEQLGMENAIDPPGNVKSELMGSIGIPAGALQNDSPVISLHGKNNSRRYLYVAASIAALLLINSIWMYNNWQSAEKRLDALTEQSDDLKTQLVEMETELKETSNWFNMVNDPGSRKLVMNGNSLSPESTAVVYLNEASEKVMIKTDGLAELEEDKTYQVWADVEGEMIDMGVIPKGQDMVALKYINKAESFNITIEPAGGNDHPTVEALITNVLL